MELNELLAILNETADVISENHNLDKDTKLSVNRFAKDKKSKIMLTVERIDY